MIYLALSILFSSLNLWIFKIFEQQKINNLQAIVFNYFTCVFVGLLLSDVSIVPSEIVGKSWFLLSIALGILFIVGFNLIAATTQKAGVSIASVSSKVSMILPIIIAVSFYGDSFSIVKLIGITIAFISIIFTSIKSSDDLKNLKSVFLLPFLVWLSSALIEVILDYVERFAITPEVYPMFLIINFGLAGVLGLIYLVFSSIKNKQSITAKNLIAGLVLGVPNYFSIYFLLYALNQGSMGSSAIFPLNNIGIVLLSIFGSILFFKEKLTKYNWIGVGLAVLAIILIGFWG